MCKRRFNDFIIKKKKSILLFHEGYNWNPSRIRERYKPTCNQNSKHNSSILITSHKPSLVPLDSTHPSCMAHQIRAAVCSSNQTFHERPRSPTVLSSPHGPLLSSPETRSRTYTHTHTHTHTPISKKKKRMEDGHASVFNRRPAADAGPAPGPAPRPDRRPGCVLGAGRLQSDPPRPPHR